MFTVKLQKTDFKNSAKWQQIAKDLDLPESRNHVIVTRIPGLLPVEAGWETETNIVQPSEWLWADDAGGVHSYIVHTHSPRFIAEIVEDDELHPPFEYQLITGETLCNFTWLDPPPEDLTALLNEAENFLAEYDDKSGVD